MTPEEKAKELVEKFSKPIKCKVTLKVSLPISMHREQVIECAIITVNELVEAFMELSRQESGTTHIDFGHGYWQQVKQHLTEMKL